MYVGSASIDGHMSDLDKAVIPLDDRGFLFGHAVFETIFVLEGRVVFWEEHWKRLKNGASESRIVLPEMGEIWDSVAFCIKNNIEKCGFVSEKMQVKIVLTGGSSHSLWDENLSTNKPRSIIICRNIPGLPISVYENGISLKLIPDDRPESRLSIKGTSYIVNMLALAAAKEAGFDDALFFNQKNEITESPTANFLWLNDKNEIYTTMPGGRCLPGTTVQGFSAACKKLGVILKENVLRTDELEYIKLPCIISATRGIVPINRINQCEFDIEQYSSLIQKWNQDLRKEQIQTSRSIEKNI